MNWKEIKQKIWEKGPLWLVILILKAELIIYALSEGEEK